MTLFPFSTATAKGLTRATRSRIHKHTHIPAHAQVNTHTLAQTHLANCDKWCNVFALTTLITAAWMQAATDQRGACLQGIQYSFSIGTHSIGNLSLPFGNKWIVGVGECSRKPHLSHVRRHHVCWDSVNMSCRAQTCLIKDKYKPLCLRPEIFTCTWGTFGRWQTAAVIGEIRQRWTQQCYTLVCCRTNDRRCVPMTVFPGNQSNISKILKVLLRFAGEVIE